MASRCYNSLNKPIHFFIFTAEDLALFAVYVVLCFSLRLYGLLFLSPALAFACLYVRRKFRNWGIFFYAITGLAVAHAAVCRRSHRYEFRKYHGNY